jgi:AcrR family transcriptional regulator
MRGEARRAQIVSAAETCFAQRGFRGTTTAQIARACDVSEAILFRHFPTKQRLYQAILEARLGGEADYPPFERFSDDQEFFRTAVAGTLERMSSDPLFMKILLYSALEENELAFEFFRKRVDRTIRYITSYVRKRQREGILRDIHPEAAARGLLGMAVHYALVTRLFRSPPLAEIEEKTLPSYWADLFLNGLRATKEKRNR